MAKTKVLISIGEADLKAIDKHATRARMSRSEYMVAIARNGESASLVDSIENLQRDLEVVLHDVRMARAAGESGMNLRRRDRAKAIIETVMEDKTCPKTLREFLEEAVLELDDIK